MNLTAPRICIINDDRYPSRWTNTQQTIKTASALVADHADVEVVLPRMWDVMFASNARRRQLLETFYGVTTGFGLTQIPSVPPSPLRIEKFAHGVLAPIYSMFAVLDVIYSRIILPLTLALAAGKHVMFESHRVLRDHYPVTHQVVKAVQHHPRFLGVVTNAGMIAGSFVDMGLARDKVAIAHNCFDPADMEPRLSKAEARTKLGLPSADKIVCYTGHIQKRKGIDVIVAMAARTPELHYLICGGFPDDVAAARKLAAEAGATNLTFTGWIDVHQLSAYLYAADVLLIPPTSAPLQQHGNTVMPIKTYTYLAAGRAILAPQQDDVVEVLHHGENCWLVQPDDLDLAVSSVRRLIAEPALADRLGAQARIDSQLYTWEARARLIHDFIKTRLAATATGSGQPVRHRDHRPAAI
ncbi:MAG: glycosyltransferase family 4 protein [Proteobacteria bacterium]|nr:glycosyltransferase family 4 protein [Pseudomonadota bacterium]